MKKDNDNKEDIVEYSKTDGFSRPKFARVDNSDRNKQYQTEHTFNRFKKQDIAKWLENPCYYNDKKLIDASNYFYRVSNHYRRIVNYPALISTFDYVILDSETNSFPDTKNDDSIKKAYIKASNFIKSMNMKQEFQKIMQICFREDIFYGYTYKTDNAGSFYIKRLDYKYCRPSAIIDGNIAFEFNFTYFDLKRNTVEDYGQEFVSKYDVYKKDKTSMWQEIDLENSICIKFEDSLDYMLPPFIGITPDLFDLQSYKALKKVNENLGNYNLLAMFSPLNKEGKPTIAFERLKDYYNLMRNEMPEGVGLALTPAKLEQYSFDKAGTSTNDSVKEATDSMWSSAGITPLLFSSDKTGSAVINSSVEIDSTYVYMMYRKFERWVNYQLKLFSPNKTMKVQILDTTTLNREKKIETYKEMATYGFPTEIYVAAIIGMDICNIDFLINLEESFDLKGRMKPLQNSHVQSSKQGRQEKDPEDLSDEGAKSREKDY